MIEWNEEQKAYIRILQGKLDLMIATHGYVLNVKKEEREVLKKVLDSQG